jgi:hypothetical protein
MKETTIKWDEKRSYKNCYMKCVENENNYNNNSRKRISLFISLYFSSIPFSVAGNPRAVDILLMGVFGISRKSRGVFGVSIKSRGVFGVSIKSRGVPDFRVCIFTTIFF